MFINVKTNPNKARKPKELRVNKRNLFTPKKFILLFLMIKERTNTVGKLLKKITSIKGKCLNDLIIAAIKENNIDAETIINIP
jgi:hypothetical protein